MTNTPISLPAMLVTMTLALGHAPGAAAARGARPPHLAHWCAALLRAAGPMTPYAGQAEASLNQVAERVREALPASAAQIPNPIDVLGRVFARAHSFRLRDVRNRFASLPKRGRIERLAAHLDELERDATGLRPDVIAVGQVVKGRDAIRQVLALSTMTAQSFEDQKLVVDEPYGSVGRVLGPAFVTGLTLSYFAPIANALRDAVAAGNLYSTVAYGLATAGGTYLIASYVPRLLIYVAGLKIGTFRNLYDANYSSTSALGTIRDNYAALRLVSDPKSERPLAYLSRRVTLPTEVVDRMLAPNAARPAPSPAEADGARLVDLAPINFREVILDQFYVRADDGDPVLMSFVRIKRARLPEGRKPPGAKRRRWFTWADGGPKPVGMPRRETGAP